MSENSATTASASVTVSGPYTSSIGTKNCSTAAAAGVARSAVSMASTAGPATATTASVMTPPPTYGARTVPTRSAELWTVRRRNQTATETTVPLRNSHRGGHEGPALP